MELINNVNDDVDLGEKQSYDRLIDGKDIRFKTDVNSEQRSIISSIETSIDHFGKKGVTLHVAQRFKDSYIDMGASVDRQSRKEVVDALKAKVDNIDKQQILAKQNQQLR